MVNMSLGEWDLRYRELREESPMNCPGSLTLCGEGKWPEGAQGVFIVGLLDDLACTCHNPSTQPVRKGLRTSPPSVGGLELPWASPSLPLYCLSSLLHTPPHSPQRHFLCVAFSLPPYLPSSPSWSANWSPLTGYTHSGAIPLARIIFLECKRALPDFKPFNYTVGGIKPKLPTKPYKATSVSEAAGPALSLTLGVSHCLSLHFGLTELLSPGMDQVPFHTLFSPHPGFIRLILYTLPIFAL